MRDLTHEEDAVVTQLGDAMTQFAGLPVVHPNDTEEFVHAIHAAQNIILARPATEAMKPVPTLDQVLS